MSVLRRIAAFPAHGRGKWLILVAWLAVVAVAGPVGGKLSSVVKNDQSSYLPGDAESTRALTLASTFPSGRTLPAIVVAERSSGITTADSQLLATLADTVRAGVPHLHGAPTVLPTSRDGRARLLLVPLQGGLDGQQVRSAVTTLRAEVQRAFAGSGVTARVGGIAAITADEIESFNGIDGTLLIATLIIVVVILLVTYRSPVLWIVPLLSVGIAYTVAQAVVYELAQHAGLVVSGESQGILTVLIFGAGTDYALLLIARYREELTRHDDRHEAMATALHRVSPAVLASASTVVLGLLCLFAATLASDRGLAPVGAAGIICTFAVLVTLLPALLAIFGRFLFWPFIPHAGHTPDAMRSVWGRAGVRIMRRPRTVWIACTVLLLALGSGIVTFKGGLSNDQAFRDAPDSIRADQTIDAHYPAGVSNPADVIVNLTTETQSLAAVKTTAGVATAAVAERTATLARIRAVLADPNGTDPAFATVNRLRQRVHAIPGANALVGGESAIILDVENAAVHDREVVMPLILGVVMLVLMVLLRAVLAPVLLALSVAVSFLAALGASSLIFNALGFAGADQTLPLLGFVFLVALGVDYNIFLTEIGVLVAFGVLLDTLLVRSVLVPALVGDLGRHVWWPSRLARHDRSDHTKEDAAA